MHKLVMHSPRKDVVIINKACGKKREKLSLHVCSTHFIISKRGHASKRMGHLPTFYPFVLFCPCENIFLSTAVAILRIPRSYSTIKQFVYLNSTESRFGRFLGDIYVQKR